MSFEGRYQKICKSGHYVEEDIYMDTDKCECGDDYIETNIVDDTNEIGVGYDKTMKNRAKKILNNKGIILSFRVN